MHLDALRLFASSGVVLVHLSGFLLRSAVPPRFALTFHNLTLLVDLFFAVSGYVIAWVYSQRIVDLRSYGAFLRKRLARLLPLHWAVLVVYVAMGLFVETQHISLHEDQGLFEWRCLPANALLLNSTGICHDLAFNIASWSISAEMFMYLAAPLLFWILRRRPWALGLAAAALVAALTSFGGADDSWLFWTAAGGWLRALPSFVFGAFLFASRKVVARLPLARPALCLFLLGFLCGCSAGVRPVGLLLLLYGALVCAVAADAQKRRGRMLGLLAAGGQLTYSSYMVHQLIINVLLNGMADRVLHLRGTAMTLMTLLTFVAVWPVSYLSLVMLERPARRWLSGAHRPDPAGVETLHATGEVRLAGRPSQI